ncbi:hypothetical protein N7466_007371 [Penicillium verhagenii]|uniref:uncharacterized protein n=1 Tax=Penicillium verhagenii TaxID=1562060 RepID=UPI0025459D54|nr:uncharacterized protein N7466_007371 [Penicillium verhagenii]KAJ5928415.1 hypothetical protein N7466_007371 [Penicillium verhagenii]
MSKTILIAGATGKQGGSLIDALLQQNTDVEILAVTRDANSKGAQKLMSKSSKIHLIEGNLDHPEGIFADAQEIASQPIWGVYSVQVPVPGSSDQEAEERQGKALIDTSLKHNVKLFVYSSVDRGGDASYDTPTPVPHFISKHRIEHHLVEQTKGTEMAWTILRPVAFLENFTPDFFGKVFATSWRDVVQEKPLQVISVGDIGFFAAQAFLNPEEWTGKSLSLAGDDITFEDMAKIYKAKTGRDVPLTFSFVCSTLWWMMKDFGYMFQWFYDSGYGADISTLKEIHPGLKDFETWLETESGLVSR